ncbi:MAG: N-6 DNA methylase [Promethearchaeia archaeon]
MVFFREFEIDLNGLKRAKEEYDIENWFDNLFEKLDLSYQAQHRVLEGRPDCLIGDVILDFKYNINEKELEKWVKSKGIQYIEEYFQTRGVYPTLLIIISEENIWYYNKDGFLQNKRKISKETINSLIECLFEPGIIDSEQFAILFGINSPLYVIAYSQLKDHFYSHKAHKTVCFQQWKNNFSLAYHDDEIGVELFLRHSYLNMLLKLILYKEFMEPNEYSRDSFKGLENYFELLGISLFHYDFFRWIINVKNLCDIFFEKIKLMTFKATDIFRVIYQEMIIAGVRHRLGEYYTPEILCKKMIEKEYEIGMRVLDSSCGSGTFLIETLKKINNYFNLSEAEEPPDEWYESVNNLFGFDINPIAILTSKANFLLYLKSKKNWIEDISINIYLYNSIDPLRSSSVADIELGRYYSFCVDLLDEEMELRIPGKALSPSNIEQFQKLVKAVYNVWEDFSTFEDTWEAALNRVRKDNKSELFKSTSSLLRGIITFFRELYELKSQDKDHIWLYILNNLVEIRTLLLKKKMDLIITNPPWLTYKDADQSLRDNLKDISEEFNIKPGAHNVTNIEEAIVFLYKIPDLYLRRDGKGRVAFVLPRSILVSSQNEKARRFDYFKDLEFFEFNDMIFNIDCCCFFGTYTTQTPTKKDPMKKYPVNSRFFDAKTMEFLNIFHIEPYVYFQEKLGEKYKVKRLIKKEKKEDLFPVYLSDYYKDFIQGADLIPKSLLYVQILDTIEKGRISLIDPWISPQAKGKWKERYYTRERVESKHLFKATLSRGLYPFYIDPYDIFLPLDDHLEYKVSNIGPFARKHWKFIKKIYAKINEKDLFEVGINYRHKLCKNNKVREAQRKPYKIVFPNAKRLMAAVIEDPEGTTFVDSTLYYFGTEIKEEAFYLCGMLNIRELRKSVKTISDTRHHHKRPLYFNIPQYQGTKIQNNIARLSKECYEIVKKYVKSEGKPRARNIRKIIEDKYNQIRNLGLKILNEKEGMKVIKEYLIKEG